MVFPNAEPVHKDRTTSGIHPGLCALSVCQPFPKFVISGSKAHKQGKGHSRPGAWWTRSYFDTI